MASESDSFVNIMIGAIFAVASIAVLAPTVQRIFAATPAAQSYAAQVYVGLPDYRVLEADGQLRWLSLVDAPPFVPWITATRFKLWAQNYKDISTRFRVWVQGYQDISTRFLLTVGTLAYKDIATRYRLTVRGFEDIATRFELTAQNYKDIATRFLLWVQGYKDIASRFILNVQAYKDVATRFALQVGNYQRSGRERGTVVPRVSF